MARDGDQAAKPASERPTVLVVDDDITSLKLVAGVLRREGFPIVEARSGEAALEILRKQGDLQIVVTDWEMQGMDGIDLVRAIRADAASAYRFVLMLTGRQQMGDLVLALNSGADEFVNKPIVDAELIARLNTAERLIGVQTRDALILALAKLAGTRDNETGEHIFRTRFFSRRIAEQLRLTDASIPVWLPEMVYTCAPLHDIGKVGIPDRVLRKAGKLSDAEFDLMKTHTVIGAETIRTALAAAPGSQMLEAAYELVRHHHERWDGSGYPDGLAGDEIPLVAQIMAVADVYDALRSPRVYKPAMPHAEAVRIIEESEGSHFGPGMVEVFRALAGEFEAYADHSLGESKSVEQRRRAA